MLIFSRFVAYFFSKILVSCLIFLNFGLVAKWLLIEVAYRRYWVYMCVCFVVNWQVVFECWCMYVTFCALRRRMTVKVHTCVKVFHFCFPFAESLSATWSSRWIRVLFRTLPDSERRSYRKSQHSKETTRLWISLYLTKVDF